MKEVTLKVDWRFYNTNQLIASSLSSQTNCHYTIMNVGPLDLLDAAPLKSCMRGKEKIILVSQRTLPKDVEPVFQIWCGKTQMKDLEKHLVQPSSFTIRPMSITLITPYQDQGLDQLDFNNFKLKIAIRRIKDKTIGNSFTFKYFPHDENCMFCDYNMKTEQQVAQVVNKRKRSHHMRNCKKIDVNETTDGNWSDLEKVPPISQLPKLQSDGTDARIPLSVSDIWSSMTDTKTGSPPDGQVGMGLGLLLAGAIEQQAGEVSFQMAKGEEDAQIPDILLDPMQKDAIDSGKREQASNVQEVWKDLRSWKDSL